MDTTLILKKARAILDSPCSIYLRVSTPLNVILCEEPQYEKYQIIMQMVMNREGE